MTDTEHQAVDAARDEVLAMLTERTGVFANGERWAAWRWEPVWPRAAANRVAPEGG
ncbi:hypothetical protein [Streptomyces sp. NBC_00826]|uniref:hypothetical protein n=1 Tax=Streptomyces sp. NBC_00826 TaxID=2975845 RepID=UPI002F91B01B|nr:hypothetical protein OG832_45380 [Streptomyces sp. NBC_00826]WTB60489.1 hypothetical protein OG832_46520 [Streptomyces sp. NBC_00826]